MNFEFVCINGRYTCNKAKYLQVSGRFNKYESIWDVTILAKDVN